MRWRIERVEVPLPARDAQGQIKAQSADVTVSGNVYIFGPDAAVTSAITGVPEDFSDKRDETVSRDASQTVTILFLGEASLGEDGDDINDTLDDVEQCVVDNSDPPREVMREAGQTNCPSSPASTADTADDPESRSKLFVVTDDSTAAPTKIIGARTETHEMTGNSGRESVTIYAVLQDADENPLTGIDVDFTASPTPNDIVAPRDLVDDDETAAFGDDVAVTGIAVTDAVATFQVEGLPTNISYVVSVEVMAGDFSLGTVEIARKGDATKVIAGVFNAACFDPAGTADEPNYANATFDADAKGCDASGMANHFGHGEMIFVKAHHEDDLDLIVGDGDDLSAKLANEDDDLLGEAKAVLIEDPVMPGDPARAWIFTIDDEASLGERMITVSTSVEDEDGDDLDSVTLAITVAGPPHTYSVDGPEYIGLGESGTFTVTAVDEEGGLPYFTTVDDDATSADERNDRVSVFVADVPAGNVRGLTSGDDLVLDTDTGMGTFTVYAPRDAGQGELARIFVSEGDSEVSGSVTFGEEPPENVAPVAEGSIGDQMVDAGSYVMVDVSGAFSDADMDTLTYSAESDMMDYATVSVDGSMVTITGVAEGMATITVTASDPGELYAMQEIMVTVMMMPPMELGDPVVTGAMSDATGMATIMLTPGANADQHWIWAQPTDLSEGMFSEKVAGDATSANMTGLTSGMSYWFTAVAGRDMEDGPTEWSEYSGWSAETPIQ